MIKNKFIYTVFILSFLLFIFGASFSFAYYNKASVYEKVGRIHEAVKAYKRKIASEKMAYSVSHYKNTNNIQPLIAALHDKDAGVRKYAAYVLGDTKDPRAVTSLIRVLSDRNFWVRKEAAWALGEIKDPRSSTPFNSSVKR